jgi:hypothetical protein
VANVAVIIHNEATGLTRTVNSNVEGEYVAPEFPSGTYAVRVKAPGFKEAASTSVELHVSSTEVQNIQLQVGSTSEQGNGSGQRSSGPDRHSAALGEVVTGEQVCELPGVSAANGFDAKNKGFLPGAELVACLFLLEQKQQIFLPVRWGLRPAKPHENHSE